MTVAKCPSNKVGFNTKVRPERIYFQKQPGRPDFSFEGYISGKFLMNDKTPNLLASSRLITSNKLYFEYMSLPWTPLLFQFSQGAFGSVKSITIPDNKIQMAINNSFIDRRIVQDGYSINEINYNVKLNTPMLLVENEIYFPGWEAVLISNSKERVIRSIQVNGVFRGWVLPSGQYRMISKFSFPNKSLYIYISILAIILWIAISTIVLLFYHVQLGRSKIV